MKLGDVTIAQLADALHGLCVEWVRPTEGAPPTVQIMVSKDGQWRSYGFSPETDLRDVHETIRAHVLAGAPS